MNQPPYPVVRLKPKLDSSAIRYGAPWVFANELVTDRRTRALDPGAIAVLEDSDRRPIGVVTVNNNSKIIGRILDRNPAAVIDEAWLTHKLTQAAAMRDRLFSKPFYQVRNPSVNRPTNIHICCTCGNSIFDIDQFSL